MVPPKPFCRGDTPASQAQGREHGLKLAALCHAPVAASDNALGGRRHPTSCFPLRPPALIQHSYSPRPTSPATGRADFLLAMADLRAWRSCRSRRGRRGSRRTARADGFTQHLPHNLSPPPQALAARSSADFLPLHGVPSPCSEGTVTLL